VCIHPDASPVAKIDLDQSNPGDCHRSHSPVILGQNLHSFLDRFRGGNLHWRKTRSNLLGRPCLSTPGEHHARRNAIAARNLRHLRPGANVSSTIRTLSSCDQRRRRSNPSKTSTRIA
jgi:hypothetical protein